MKEQLRRDLRRWTGISIDIACLAGVAFLVWTVVQGIDIIRQLKDEKEA